MFRKRPRLPTTGSLPLIVAVIGDPAGLDRTERELRRYRGHYDVRCSRSPDEALSILRSCAATDQQVAVVLADQLLGAMTGEQFLAAARELHPDCKRGLLVAWGDMSTTESITRAVALGTIDYFALLPVRSPDEQFHRLIAEFLDEWTRTEGATFVAVRVVGEPLSPRSHETRDLLQRTGVPFSFLPSGSPQGQQLLKEAGVTSEHLPVWVLHTGRVLIDPTNIEAAEALGPPSDIAAGIADVVIVGAGPAGLAAAVYGASEGLVTYVVEREAFGGQAGTSSMIRNYLGFPRGLSGSELAQRAYRQAFLFGARFLLMHQATKLHRDGHLYELTLADGRQITTRTVVLATGVSYRLLGIDSLDSLLGAGVFYGAAATEARAMEGRHVYVVGGGNSAGQAAVHLARHAASVTMLVRGPSLADTMSEYLVKEIEADDDIEVRGHAEVVGGGGEGRLTWLTIEDRASGARGTVPAEALFILIGAIPHTGWLPDEMVRDPWGFVVTGADLLSADERTRWPLERPPLHLETSLPGVFAAGDIRHRSIKRVASAVGEGATSIQLCHQYLSDANTTPK